MEDTFKQIIAGLSESDENRVLESLENLTRYGKNEVVAPLIQCYFNSQSQAVKSRILEIFCDIKDTKASGIWVENMITNIGKEGFRELVGCCWQSAIGFHNHLNSFAEIIVKTDLYTSLEALTVIENNLSNAKFDDVQKIATYLRNEIPAMNEDKRKLIELFLSDNEL